MAFLFNHLLAVGQSIETASEGMPRKWAQKVVQHAKEKAPVRTGYMRDHIVDTSTDQEGAAEAQADYSGYVEYGTVHMHAEPYFTPAVEQANAELPDVVGTLFGAEGGIVP